MREAEIQRTTYETDIKLRINLDGSGRSTIDMWMPTTLNSATGVVQKI